MLIANSRQGLAAVTVLALGLAALSPNAIAIQPQRWTHTTEADFEPGETDSTVVTNHGDITLAAATETLDELPEGVTIIHDIEIVEGVTYIAAGPEGKLLKLEDGQVVEIASFENEQIFSLHQADGLLLLGISGQDTRVAVWHPERGETISIRRFDEESHFIWDMLLVGDNLFVATGPEGKIYMIRDAADYVEHLATGNPTDPIEPPGYSEILDTAQVNILCLAVTPDGKTLYAGTDTDGLIYRLTPNGDGYNAFVIFDAPEPEIGSVLVMSDGTVYVGTADAEQARPGRLEDAEDEENGRPESDPTEPQGDPEAVEIPGATPDPEELAQDNADDVADTDEAGESEDASPEETTDESVEPETDTESDEAATVSEETIDTNTEPDTEVSTDDADDIADEPATSEQLDAVREVIRERLLAARKTGVIKSTTNQSGGSKSSRPTRRASAASTGESEGGNAVYRIDTQGFVSSVFRESVMILRIDAEATDDDTHRLLIATGPEGQLFRVDVEAGETSVLINLEASHIPAALPVGDGSILLGTADGASLITLSPGTALRGTYTSETLDAEQISLWGVFNLLANVPEDSSLTVETRSGNVADPEIAAWSEWSTAQVFTPDPDLSPLAPREVKIDSPPARFLQYRLTLTSNGQNTPSVGRVELAYVMPNLAPKVTTLTAGYPETGQDEAPATMMDIEWEATDPNGDRLLYDLEFQPAGSDKWLNLAADLTDAGHGWETARVPDGRYLLRVTADDRLDNPGTMAKTAARRSDPVLVDNTPPALKDLKIAVKGVSATISGVAVDALAPIASIAYSLNDAEEYTPILPEDLIYDSTRERFVATISDLSSGSHVLTVRVRDLRGNTTHHPVIFEVK